MKRRLSTRLVAVVLMGALILMLIPMFAIGRCAVPQLDDFRNGRPMHDALMAGGGAGGMLAAGVAYTNDVYRNWQGTWGAVLLMTLQPFIFGMPLYCLSVFFLLLSLLGCMLYLVWMAGKHLLGCSASERWCLYALVMIPCTQWLPSPLEGFYYYVGGVFYSFYFSLSALLGGLMIAFLCRKKGKRRNAVYYVLIPLVSAFIAGGNYTTGLIVALLLLAALCFSLFVQKSRNALLPLSFLLFLAVFCLSLFAPGNMSRQHLSTGLGNVVIAGLRSVVKALRCTLQWTTLPMLLLLAAGVPLAWRFAGRTGFSFRLPLIPLAAAIFLPAAGFMSTYYTQGYPGAARLIDIQYHMYVLGAFFNMIYLTGWLYKRVLPGLSAAAERITALYERGRTRIIAGFALLVALTAAANYDGFAGVQAALSLVSGEASGFRQEMLGRFEALENSDEAVVAVPPLRNRPALLLLNEYADDPAYWGNLWVSEYFHKEGVYVDAAMPSDG